jgi:hypothetical protein
MRHSVQWFRDGVAIPTAKAPKSFARGDSRTAASTSLDGHDFPF